MRWLIFLILLLTVVVISQRPQKQLTFVETPAVILPVNVKEVSPTPAAERAKQLTFEEMNRPYGPCTTTPVLFYHHVEPAAEAVRKGHNGLYIDNEVFRRQMVELKEKGYETVSPEDLARFFDEGKALPSKSVMITFDDGYDDNGIYAFPILKELGMKGVIFIPTGLIQNEGYLTWEKVMEMYGSGYIFFANHTWSHMNAGKDRELVKKEITTADIQLSEKGLNLTRAFAYPYGEQNGYTQDYLREMGYKLGFTTKYGRVLCQKQRLSLPRVRMSGTSLKNLGF